LKTDQEKSFSFANLITAWEILIGKVFCLDVVESWLNFDFFGNLEKVSISRDNSKLFKKNFKEKKH
jgi:hypothetical protein